MTHAECVQKLKAIGERFGGKNMAGRFSAVNDSPKLINKCSMLETL